MSHFLFFCFCLSAGLTDSSGPRMLNKRLDCNQPRLNNCTINNCSDEQKVPNTEAPTGPDSVDVTLWKGKHELVPVLNVTWKINIDSSIWALKGSQINIVDETTNHSLCVQFSYSFKHNTTLHNQNHKWTFSLDEVEVEFGHTYMVTVFNLPEPENGDNRKRTSIAIPGCDDKRIQQVRMCLENGSLWNHSMQTQVLTNGNIKLSIVVTFKASQYSEKYRVSILNSGILCSKNVSKENATTVNVTFEFERWQLRQCEISVMVQPFFRQCQNNCLSPNKTIDYCQYYPTRTYLIKAAIGLLLISICLACLLWRASHKDPLNTSSPTARDQPQVLQVKERKSVLIIHSLDHPLYKNIVLKLCAFLMNKCGTEVVLDLLDSSRLGVLGKIQWLDWHKEQIEKSSAKILILCSRGVQAKWRAMCGDKQVFMREDACSSVGDMLTPSLSLLVPHFIRSASFKKYIVAYFDGISSEEDVPSPFNITVRYKLMKQFEEVFFRILDLEKHEPGIVKKVEGLSEDTYHLCPSGRALYDAIEAFRAYQLKHPRWFEEELLESSELEFEETSCEIYKTPPIYPNFKTDYVLHPAQVISHHVQTSDDFTTDETKLYLSENLQVFSSMHFHPLIVQNS
ncbi:interleukin-17 receptor A isoform X1 [Oreochromis aureus]|uniref:interleukin-17 receptor A isoform X1 n=2 Tax=Oreochromis aureus TaxID=47969 RepID=UPI0012BCB3B9|nr:interleukin-17 receptor A isoform X1 [Oreochromis aureus]